MIDHRCQLTIGRHPPGSRHRRSRDVGQGEKQDAGFAFPFPTATPDPEYDRRSRLRVVDDGVGIRKEISKGDGLGLRIMRYRATSIGALSIEPGADGATVVTCSLRAKPLPTESEGLP